jgi:hypothetical protein
MLQIQTNSTQVLSDSNICPCIFIPLFRRELLTLTMCACIKASPHSKKHIASQHAMYKDNDNQDFL